MAIAHDRLIADLRSLRLGYMAEIMDRYAQQAADEGLSHLEFLARLVEDVMAYKADRRLQIRLKQARFPHVRQIFQFDFDFQPSVPAARIRELAELRFLAHHENVIFLGPPGVGKTHLAVALGVEACRAGHSVLFTTVSDLLQGLRGAPGEPPSASKLAVYLKPSLLIIDDIGVLPLERSDAYALFTLVSRRYEKGSLVITSNKSFLEWGEILGDPVLASATLDRLLHHAHIFNIRGESYRLRERRQVLTATGGLPSVSPEKSL